MRGSLTSSMNLKRYSQCVVDDIPGWLRHRIGLLREAGRMFRAPDELFAENSWTQVTFGQGIVPRTRHPVTELMDDAELERFLGGIRAHVERTVRQSPSHQAYVDAYCPAAAPA